MKTIDIDKLLEIGIALSGEKDKDRLLYTILTSAMDITGCDGGTLYIINHDKLEFRVMINLSMGIDMSGDAITMPPVPLDSPSNVSSRTARDGVLLNIPDVYSETRFDFSGTRRYDEMTGYKTTSLLCLPMKNDHDTVIGVLQLINAQNNAGETIPFSEEYEKVVMSLASQAAISLTNTSYSIAITELFNSFVRVMSTAIDARSPYNANHTRNMVKYAERFIDWLDTTGNEWSFSENVRKEFLMSVWLHDVGKLIIPLEIMDKETRLGAALERVESRFEKIALLEHIRCLEDKLSGEEREKCVKVVHDALDLVLRVNTAPFVSDEMLSEIRALSEKTYTAKDGSVVPWLLPDELEALSVRKGTLTDSERGIMQGHVTMTERMLSEMEFLSELKRAPVWAAMHHEFINGKGYPKGLSDSELPREVRLLTILDVFDALTAMDRPYKKAMTAESAFNILDKMAESREIDAEILKLFKMSGAYAAEG